VGARLGFGVGARASVSAFGWCVRGWRRAAPRRAAPGRARAVLGVAASPGASAGARRPDHAPPLAGRPDRRNVFVADAAERAAAHCADAFSVSG